MSRLDRQQTRTGFAMISPWLVGFLLLTVYPFAATFAWSYCKYDLLGTPQWEGLANYRRLAADLAEGGPFRQALFNTAYYSLFSVLLSVALGVLLAALLSWPVRGRAVCRTLCFLPAVVPTVAAAVLWMWLLDQQDGLINGALRLVELPPQNWFQGATSAAWPPSWPAGHAGRVFGSKDGLILMSLWGVGNFMMIYLAAISDVPASLYEAARIDGASGLRRFWHVTLPILTPVIFFNVVVGLIQSVQAFTQIYVVSDGQGGPAGTAMTLSLYLFLSAFKDLDMGYASAMAWIVFLLVLLATVWLFRTSRYWVHDQGATT